MSLSVSRVPQSLRFQCFVATGEPGGARRRRRAADNVNKMISSVQVYNSKIWVQHSGRLSVRFLASAIFKFFGQIVRLRGKFSNLVSFLVVRCFCFLFRRPVLVVVAIDPPIHRILFIVRKVSSIDIDTVSTPRIYMCVYTRTTPPQPIDRWRFDDMTEENWTHVSDRKRYGIGESSAWNGCIPCNEHLLSVQCLSCCA